MNLDEIFPFEHLVVVFAKKDTFMTIAITYIYGLAVTLSLNAELKHLLLAVVIQY